MHATYTITAALLYLASLATATIIGTCFRASDCQDDPRQPGIDITQEPGNFTLFKSVRCASCSIEEWQQGVATHTALLQTALASRIR